MRYKIVQEKEPAWKAFGYLSLINNTKKEDARMHPLTMLSEFKDYASTAACAAANRAIGTRNGEHDA